MSERNGVGAGVVLILGEGAYGVRKGPPGWQHLSQGLHGDRSQPGGDLGRRDQQVQRP